MNTLYKDAWEKGLTYESYISLIDKLLLEDKTTGAEQSPRLLEYTRLNQHRMNRIYKTFTPDPRQVARLGNAGKNLKLMAISEAWCGDASQIIPTVAKLAEAAGVSFKVILRDAHPEVMNMHLTNGSKSIPMILFLNALDYSPAVVWGPRPAEAQRMMMEYKHSAEPKPSHDEFVKELQLWYTKDKQHSIQEEIASVAEGVFTAV